MKAAEGRASSCTRRSFCCVLGALALGACRKKAPLDALGTLGAFELTDQEGRRFGSAQLTGGPWVAAFFFTRCPTICPRISLQMREIQKKAVARSLGLRLVSISVDPENDTPAVLRAYARDYGADAASWTFLTGERAVVEKLSAEMKLALEGRADAAAKDLGIIHGGHLVLVDRGLVIRGYYRSSDPAEMSKLVEDAAGLV